MLGLVGLALNPQAWMAAGIVALFAFGSGYFKGRESVDVVGIQQKAFVKGQIDRDGTWKAKLDETERQASLAVEAAIAERDAAPAVGPDADLMQLCRKSSTCRDRGGK